MITWRDAWLELARRPGRTLLSLLSVVIAVAAIVAVAASTGMTRQAYQRVFRTLAGSADLEVTPRSEGGSVNEADLSGLDKIPGVRAVVPVFNRATNLTIPLADGKNKTVKKILLEGVVLDQPDSIDEFTVTAGHWPEKKDEVMVDAQLAGNLELKPGDSVKFMTRNLRVPCEISGLIRMNDAAHLLQGGMVLVPIARLQHWFNSPNSVDGLHLFLEPDVDRNQVIDEASQLLTEDLQIGVPSARFGMADDSLKLTQVSLNLTSALSMTTAMFIVLNVFLMNVGERRRQISILRAIGATRRQIIRMVTGEALLLGIAGTLVGIPVGIYGGRILAGSMAQILQVDLPDQPTLWWPLAIGGVFGPLLCLIGAWHPARKASAVSPLEGLRPTAAVHPKLRHRRATIYGLILTVICTSTAVWSAVGGAPMGVAVATVILSLVAAVLLMPVAMSPAVRAVSRLVGRLGGYPMEIAERLVVRETGRTALTVGVLFMAVSAGLGTSNAVLSITNDINEWCDQTLTADYLLRTMLPDMTVRNASTMPESLGDEIKAIPGVTQLDTGRVMAARADGQKCLLTARDFSIYHKLPLAMMVGEPKQVLDRLQAGEVVVGAVLAQRANVSEGSILELAIDNEKHTFRVAGVCNEYTMGGMMAYVDRKTAEKQFNITGVDGFLISARHPVSPEVKAKLVDFAARDGLLLNSFTEVRTRIDDMVSGVVAGLWILLALGLLVGALGVVNTLTINVLEQTRELGMLRAIGMPRGQLIRTVLSQAVLIGFLGIAAGAASGLLLAWMINLSLGSLFGHSVRFAMRAEFVAILISGAVAIVLSAAMLPAFRAARLSPIEAMRSE